MAAATNYRGPPQLTNEISYTDWKKEIDFWQIATDIKPEKQGAAIFLSLSGKSREAVLELTKEEIAGANGVTKVTEKLDELWKEDDKKQAFNAYESFEQFQRPHEMGVTDFLNAFERLNNKLKKNKMILPEGVLAYRVLKSANLTTEQEQLARATVTDITYKAMCDKLKSIFGDNKQPSNENRQGILKVPADMKHEPFYCDDSEDVYYNDSPTGYGQRGRPPYRSSRGGGRRIGFGGRFQREIPGRSSQEGYGRIQDRRNNQEGYERSQDRRNQQEGYERSQDRRNNPERSQDRRNQQKKNPVDRTGHVSRCTICDSTCHWVKDCPHRSSFTLFTTSVLQECYISKLVGGTFSGGLLDSGCTKTVCGTEWYEDFVKSLSKDD